MVCQWAFRSLSYFEQHGPWLQADIDCSCIHRTYLGTDNPNNDTEIIYRGVPGIRIPGLSVKVQESRLPVLIGSARQVKERSLYLQQK